MGAMSPIIDAGVITDRKTVELVVKEMFNHQLKNEHKEPTDDNGAEYYFKNKNVLIAEFLMSSKNVKEKIFCDIFSFKYDTESGILVDSKERLIVVVIDAIKKHNSNDKIAIKIRS
jgi:hypothetical protein